MDIVKEIIIILLRATLALNFANIEESNKTHKKQNSYNAQNPVKWC